MTIRHVRMQRYHSHVHTSPGWQMPNDSLNDTLASFSSRKSKSQSQFAFAPAPVRRGRWRNAQRLEPFVRFLAIPCDAPPKQGQAWRFCRSHSSEAAWPSSAIVPRAGVDKCAASWSRRRNAFFRSHVELRGNLAPLMRSCPRRPDGSPRADTLRFAAVLP